MRLNSSPISCGGLVRSRYAVKRRVALRDCSVTRIHGSFSFWRSSGDCAFAPALAASNATANADASLRDDAMNGRAWPHTVRRQDLGMENP